MGTYSYGRFTRFIISLDSLLLLSMILFRKLILLMHVSIFLSLEYSIVGKCFGRGPILFCKWMSILGRRFLLLLMLYFIGETVRKELVRLCRDKIESLRKRVRLGITFRERI